MTLFEDILSPANSNVSQQQRLPFTRFRAAAQNTVPDASDATSLAPSPLIVDVEA